MVDDSPSSETFSINSQDRRAEELLFQACLDERATSPRKRQLIFVVIHQVLLDSSRHQKCG
jgi:hypothetical protein